jgi:5-methylcytosine-specific restriction endonuclease McrA
LLVTIAEIDERKIWAKHGCSSMFTFCMERFHMSEQVTAKRLWAARTARRFPVILSMVECGELHLAAIHLLAGHLTAENHAPVLERAKHKSSREVERLVAELAPRADVPSRIRAMPGLRRAAAQAGAPAAVGSSKVAAVSSDAGSVSSDASSVSSEAAWSDSGSVSGDATLAARDQAAGLAHRQLWADNEVAGTASDRQPARALESGTVAKPIVPLSPRRYKIEITVDEATHDKLRSLQDLLGRSVTGRDPAAIISRAIDVLLDRTLARRAGCTDRPKSTKEQCADSTSLAADAAGSQRGPRTRMIPASVQQGARTRTIPAAVRREVWRRDCGRCCYVDALGRRCAATSNVEFHHRKPFAAGGGHTPENIELRCAAHNQYQADLDFGRYFMDGKRGKAANIPRVILTDGGRRGTTPAFMDGSPGKAASIPRGMSADGGREETAATSIDGGRGKPAPTFPGECRETAAAP